MTTSKEKKQPLQLIYKYYGFETGLKALQNKTLGFNQPSYFNDPMEGHLWLHEMGVDTNFLNSFLDKVGILCMTKNPLNPLMWSHYGVSHSGFVIGYDVNDPILGPQRDSVFNIHNGKVFYSHEFKIDNASDHALKAVQWLTSGMDDSRTSQIEEILRHILLMKQEFWSYEEEIRIIKLLWSTFSTVEDWISITGNNYTHISTPIAPREVMSNSKLSLLNVAPESIKQVILGMENPLLLDDIKVNPDADLTDFIEMLEVDVNTTKWSENGFNMEIADVKVNNWGYPKKIQTKKLSPDELTIISEKLSKGNLKGQNLTLTKYIDKPAKAFWDNELQASPFPFGKKVMSLLDSLLGLDSDDTR